LKGLLEGKTVSLRENALFGYHGKAVNITDGKFTYFRSPVEGNKPCFNYCVIPTTLWRFIDIDLIDRWESGPFLRHTDYPVLKIPLDGVGLGLAKETQLFDIQADYGQLKALTDKDLEKQWVDKLAEAMKQADAPEEQYERLGIKKYL
jgi:hypothetical protein